jgi:hypothetical protein
MHRCCFTLFVIATAWLGFAQPSGAQGTIAYFRPDVPIPLFTYGFAEYHPVDFDQDGNSEFTFVYDFHFIGVRADNANRILLALSPPPNVGGPVAPLPVGFPIGPDSGMGGLAWAARSEFDPFEVLIQCFDTGCGGAFRGQNAYMGVEFQRAGDTHYGWVLLNIVDGQPSGQIESWAWETRPGVAILAGAVPEPSTWALLILGGGLFVWFRRERNEGRG